MAQSIGEHTRQKKVRIPNTLTVNGKRKSCRIFDLGPDGPADRFTVAFRGYRVPGHGMVYPFLASDERPFHPQGFGQHGEHKEFLTGKHLGNRIRYEECPKNLQRFIIQNLSDE